VHVGELKQIFNAIDPSPFRDKDLDPKAEEFIVGLVVDLDGEAGLPDEAAVLRDAIYEFFKFRELHKDSLPLVRKRPLSPKTNCISSLPLHRATGANLERRAVVCDYLSLVYGVIRTDL
jgi:hypothetical protein